MLTAQIGDRDPGLRFLEKPNNLHFRERLLHLRSPFRKTDFTKSGWYF